MIMKKAIIFFIVLALAIFIGSFMAKDSGYVLIAYQTFRLETSLWVALICLILLFVLMYILIRVFHHTKTLPHKIKRWNTQAQQKSMFTMAQLGTQSYLEKNFKRSEKYFAQLLRKHPQMLIYYILAAHAAQAQHNYAARDRYLTQAYKTIKHAGFPIQLEQVNLYLQANQQESAMAILKKLYKTHPKHPYVICQLCDLYRGMKDWRAVKQLLVPLKKYKAVSTHALLSIEIKTYKNILYQSRISLTDVQKAWQSMPKYLHKNIELVKMYVQYLFDYHKILPALVLIETTLKRHWNNDLLKLYSLHAYQDVRMQLKTAQKWLTNHPSDGILYFTIGRLYCHTHEWNKAKHYLEKSIDVSPQPFSYQLLGQIEEQLGHKDSAFVCYRNVSSNHTSHG